MVLRPQLVHRSIWNLLDIAGTILQLQSTMEFHRQLIHQHHLQSHLHCGNDPTVANHNGIPSATPPPAPLAMPFALRERSYSCKSQWNSIGNSSTSTTCNPIYIAGTILQLQITMEFCRPHMHEKQLKPHLQCGTDPSMIRPHTRPSRTRRTAEVDHRGSGTDFVWKNIRFRASAISQKRISCETSFKTPSATSPPTPLAMPFALRERSYSCKSQWNSIGNSSTSTTCNPICIAGTILQLQITMEFHQQLLHQHHLQCHLHCGNDPTVANHNGIPSATHPPALLAIPFTLRERSCSCKSQWNSVDRTCTKNSWNPIYNAEPIRAWSDHTRDRLAPVALQR